MTLAVAGARPETGHIVPALSQACLEGTDLRRTYLMSAG